MLSGGHMKGFGKQIVAGLTVAVFIATATYMVIYTAGCGSSGGSDESDVTPTPTTTPTSTPTPSPTPSPTGPPPTAGPSPT